MKDENKEVSGHEDNLETDNKIDYDKEYNKDTLEVGWGKSVGKEEW